MIDSIVSTSSIRSQTTEMGDRDDICTLLISNMPMQRLTNAWEKSGAYTSIAEYSGSAARSREQHSSTRKLGNTRSATHHHGHAHCARYFNVVMSSPASAFDMPSGMDTADVQGRISIIRRGAVAWRSASALPPAASVSPIRVAMISPTMYSASFVSLVNSTNSTGPFRQTGIGARNVACC